MIVLHLLVFVLLAAAAGLQLNDPDPWFWVGFYGACALVPLLALFRINSRIVYGLCLLYGLAALVLTGEGFLDFLQNHSGESLLQAMGPDKPYIEETREFIGALIVLVVITIYTLAVRRGKDDFLFLKK